MVSNCSVAPNEESGSRSLNRGNCHSVESFMALVIIEYYYYFGFTALCAELKQQNKKYLRIQCRVFEVAVPMPLSHTIYKL